MTRHTKRRTTARTLVSVLLAATGIITLLVIATRRLGDTALAILAGAVVGVLVAVPLSLAIVIVTRRAERARRPDPPPQQPRPQPPPKPQVLLVSQPGVQQLPTARVYNPPAAPVRRTFQTIGDTDD